MGLFILSCFKDLGISKNEFGVRKIAKPGMEEDQKMVEGLEFELLVLKGERRSLQRETLISWGSRPYLYLKQQ